MLSSHKMKLQTTVLLLILSAAGNGYITYAQSFYNNGSTVSILDGTIFSVKDSLVNTGTFVNNGNLVIGGTWLNNGQYTPGAGEITFNSTSATTPQIINHNNQSFSKLSITGGGKKLILADMTIEDEIILTDGVIEAQNNAHVIINPTASITGGSDQSHINATVYQHGSGDKLFPLGNGSRYLPVSVSGIEDPSAVIGITGIELEGGILPKAPSLDAISDKRYWQIDAPGGILNSRITLPLRDEVLQGSEGNIVVAESQDLTFDFISAGQSAFAGSLENGSVTSERLIVSPYVTLASTSDNGELIVYNAISPNGEEPNEFLIIGNIEYYPENTFSVFSRWGDKVFEIENYDNKERVFRGMTNIGGEKELVNGTYFYVVETKKDGKKTNGFLTIKR